MPKGVPKSGVRNTHKRATHVVSDYERRCDEYEQEKSSRHPNLTAEVRAAYLKLGREARVAHWRNHHQNNPNNAFNGLELATRVEPNENGAGNQGLHSLNEAIKRTQEDGPQDILVNGKREAVMVSASFFDKEFGHEDRVIVSFRPVGRKP